MLCVLVLEFERLGNSHLGSVAAVVAVAAAATATAII